MKSKITVKDALIVNALDAADIGYWARVPRGCRDHQALLDGTQTATVEEYDEATGATVQTYVLTGAKVRAGLELMAVECPHLMADLLNDNADIWTGDALVQFSLLGELRYG